MSTWNWMDNWIVVTGVLCAVSAALLGNFLVLRRMSMMGDAITHAVLPGLAVAFFVSESRSSLPMFFGAVVVGVLTALLTEWIRRFGRVDEGASMGVVFTSLFALGLVMIVKAADNVHLDADCVLYGALEFTPLDTTLFAGYEVPRAVVVLGAVTIINALFVLLFFKELKISSFDPSLATTTGFNANFMHYALMVLVAMTAVASFESVGNILVVAMFIVPPAAAYMLTDRLSVMILLSVVLAAGSAVGGHIAALEVPAWFGFRSTTTAGMMAVVSGFVLLLCVLFGPRHGILTRAVRRRLLSWQILADDIVALLYRLQEREGVSTADPGFMRSTLLAGPVSFRITLGWLSKRQLVQAEGDGVQLTADGEQAAQKLVRSHRLWEQYLSSYANIESERVHDKAENFEHFTDRSLRNELDAATQRPDVDPHGAKIPSERNDD